MRIRRLAAALIAVPVAFAMAPPASAAPPEDVPYGRGPDERGRSADAPGRQPDEPGPAAKLPGQPRDDTIEDVPVDPDDASIAYNLIPYHEIPPTLRELQDSDRISVEIIGESALGRDMHLVVATSPMSDAEWDEWQRLSDLRIEDPHAALDELESGGYDDWRTPLLVNNNIHGNEWEGTDASLEVLEELAFSDDPEVVEVLDEHVVAFVVTNNPDGRVAGQRQNANGFDLNRDYITGSQPEVRNVRAQIVRYSPLTMLDMHGYVWSNATGGAGLIEPTTGPHGDNYEYDLYIPQALRNALAMEARVQEEVGDDLAAFADARSGFNFEGRAHIPYRDQQEGWDDWPPIFTPMYAMYHGTIGHTIEMPINPRGQSDEEERHLRTSLNTRFAVSTITANIDYATENQEALLADQLEWFRRGVDGESSRPIDDQLALDLAFGDNAKTLLQDYPRAYVIPVGSGQRDDAAAARLVQFMIDNDVTVHRAWRPFTLNGETYDAGSYVVDMLQSKRGLANAILDVGRDVTDDFDQMYDISAWSHGHLWGATVQRVGSGSLNDGALRPVSEASPSGSVAAGNRSHYGLEALSVAGIQAVNHLLDNGAELSRTPDGTFVVPGDDLALVRETADTYGVAFTKITPPETRDATPVTELQVGVSAPSDEVFALTRMGFDLTSVDDEGFNSGAYEFDDFDALFVSTTGFDPTNLDADEAADFEAWLADGGTVVGRGFGGDVFNDRAELLDVESDTGRFDANGIVAVVNDPESPITGRSISSAFVSSPRYFTSVGDGVRIDQRLE
ncbi:MAG: M14 family zinc carboxypeptidase, partial [Actinomycetota bacterium]